MTTMDRPHLIDQWTEQRCRKLWYEMITVYRDSINRMDLTLIERVNERLVTPREALDQFREWATGPGFRSVEWCREKSKITIIGNKRYTALACKACDLFRVDPWELTGCGRHDRVVAARMFISKIMHEKYKMSYPDISTLMRGGVGHSTIITAHRRINKAIETGQTFEVWNDATERFENWPCWEILERLNDGTP